MRNNRAPVTRTPGPAARKMRRAEDKERAILVKDNAVTGKDLDEQKKKRVSEKIAESEESEKEEKTLEEKKGKGYLRDPIDAVKRVD